MKILVTGAGGFIGGQITRELVRRGHNVVALTRSRAGGLGAAQVVALDLLDPEAARSGVLRIRYDTVIHAAALMASPHLSANVRSFASNEVMTQRLLEGLGAHPPTFLLVISSIDVYSPAAEVIDEDTVVSPATEYARSKLATERACLSWAATRGCPLGIARLTQVFGPGDRTLKFIPAALSAIRSGNSVKVFGDGEDRRDYLFIDDAGAVIGDWVEARFGGTLNVATGKSHSMKDVLRYVEESANLPFRIERLPRVKERRDYQFDITRLRRALGAPVFTPLPDALRATFNASTDQHANTNNAPK